MRSTSAFIKVLLLSAGTETNAVSPFANTNSGPEIETRTMEEIHQAALKEGGVVTLWHGGDESNRQEALKQAFEAAYPGMTLNVTVDLSKYHDARLNQQLANNNVYIDSIVLQTVNNYPRWAAQGALMQYAPIGFDQIYPAYKDTLDASWYGMAIYNWAFVWNTDKMPDLQIKEWADILKPELKDKLVLTYPNDDDAVLYAFNLLLERYGTSYFDSLLAQNPQWVRGTGTPVTLLKRDNTTVAATFTSSIGWGPSAGLNSTLPSQGPFVSWAQTGAILKDAPHPEGAKLLHNFMISADYQATKGWSVRQDVPLPAGFTWGPLDENKNTNAASFMPFMTDRAEIGRLKDWIESNIGTPQGVSPLVDGI